MAGKVSYLYQRDDFLDLVEEAARRKRIPNPAIVAKDYFVTEALRIIAREFGAYVLFKGGTSLSKGWGLIDRFSEDIDLYVRPAGTEDETRERFRGIADAVGQFSGFTSRTGRKEKPKIWNSWTEEFQYEVGHDARDAIRPTVLLEAGIQSAEQPAEVRSLTSIVSQVLDEAGVPSDTADREPFAMELLHFRRTFVEKLFTLHSRVVRAEAQAKPLGRDARHFYDIAMLLRQPDTVRMLESPEYATICREYADLTRQFFPSQSKHLPEGMRLSVSPALFPDADLRRRLAVAYTQEADTLCYGEYPRFDEVLIQLEAIRHHL